MSDHRKCILYDKWVFVGWSMIDLFRFHFLFPDSHIFLLITAIYRFLLASSRWSGLTINWFWCPWVYLSLILLQHSFEWRVIGNLKFCWPRTVGRPLTRTLLHFPFGRICGCHFWLVILVLWSDVTNFNSDESVHHDNFILEFDCP